MRLFFITFLTLLAFPALSDWTINNQESTLNFVSIKKNTIAENNHFKKISGGVSNDGTLNVVIDLSSVATNIDIRDQRLRDFVFEIAKHATASYQAKVDMNKVNKMRSGEKVSMTVEGTLHLHGMSQAMTADVQVLKVGDNELLVATNKPMLVKAETFGLIDGINHLQSLAGLPSISQVVPVSFIISLNN